MVKYSYGEPLQAYFQDFLRVRTRVMTILTHREFSTLQDRVNRIFRESYSPEGPGDALTTANFAPLVDVYEDEHNITLKIEVAGIDEKDNYVRIEEQTPHVRCGSAGLRGKRKRRISSESSGNTEALPVRSRCPTL